jgi:ComF family protein
MSPKSKFLTIGNPLLRGVLDLVYPPECLLCAESLHEGNWCDRCDKQLSLSGSHCPRCAASFPTMSTMAVNCPHCQDEDYAFSRAWSLGSYDQARRSAVLLMKEQRNEVLAHHMGGRLASAMADVTEAVIVPVPLHWTRRLWRGYNQSATMAQALAKALKLPYSTRCLWRQLQTPQQASVTPVQRRKNLREAMQARLPPAWKGKRVLLVDDVMTTGATADACARTLLAAGAGQVEVVVVARAVGDQA